MPDRPKLGPGSGVIPGLTFFTEYQSVMKGLWDSSCLPLTGVAGTADDVEAVLDWPLDAGLIDGMKFTLTWAATNTGPMTLRLVWSGGNTAQVDVLTADGSAMGPAEALVGTRVLVEYIGGSFRVIGGGEGGGTLPYYVAITSSVTWLKPPGFADDAMVIVEMWGGGGGGARNSGSNAPGGGGGAYHRVVLRYADLPASVPVTIGAGGAGRSGSNGSGSAGGQTTFGSIASADRGRGAIISSPFRVDGGFSLVDAWKGGEGSLGDRADDGVGKSAFGGAGGGGATASVDWPGGETYFGGAGGDGARTGSANPGQPPGGGGGGFSGNNNGGDGARGEVRIWIVG